MLDFHSYTSSSGGEIKNPVDPVVGEGREGRRRRRWRRARSEANPYKTRTVGVTPNVTHSPVAQSRLSELSMVRQFKHHEKKLLKKVDFFNVRSIIRLVVFVILHNFVVEARCKPPGDQNYAQVSHTRS